MQHDVHHDLQPREEFRRRADAHRNAMTLALARKITQDEFNELAIAKEVMSRKEWVDWTRRAQSLMRRYECEDYSHAEAYSLSKYLLNEVGSFAEGDYDEAMQEATGEHFDPNDEEMSLFNEMTGKLQGVILDVRREFRQQRINSLIF